MLQKFNSQLREHQACEGCEVTGLYFLRGPDPEGCNWSTHYDLKCRQPGRREACDPIATALIHKLRAEYNLS
ncbi:MAG: hypothetical protein ACREUA_03470 [Burkholderiales bacterium]